MNGSYVPLTDRILRALAYLFTAVVGWYTLLVPPSSVATALGQSMAVVWALMMTGGLPAAWFTMRHRFRGEYVSLFPVTTALVVAVIAVWINIPEHNELIPRVAVASALACLLLVRLLVLHRLTCAQPPG